ATGRSPPRSPTRARSTTPRTTTSSTWARTRAATAASAAPACPARSASPRRNSAGMSAGPAARVAQTMLRLGLPVVDRPALVIGRDRISIEDLAASDARGRDVVGEAREQLELAVVAPAAAIAGLGERVISTPSIADVMHVVDAECVVAQDVRRRRVAHEASATRHALAAALVIQRISPRSPPVAMGREGRRHAEGVPADRRRRARGAAQPELEGAQQVVVDG